jgi:aminobenzoyl-glutamate transport protein
MSTAAPPVRPSRADRFLGAVERVGNRLPEPFALFLILFLVIALVSTFMALADVTVQVPGAEEVTRIQGLFTPEGLTRT